MRLLPLLGICLLLTACSSTREVQRQSVAELAELDHALRGRIATVNLTSGESERGRIQFVRTDSTAWVRERERRAVPTGDVTSLVRNTRPGSAATGVAVGGGLGVLLALVGAAQMGDVTENFIWTFFAVPAGVFYGAIIGSVAGDRTEYKLLPPDDQ